MDLKAKPDCCEEASILSAQFYIPCNHPAKRFVYLKNDDKTYRMCKACAAHNVRNRGGEDRGPYVNRNGEIS